MTETQEIQKAVEGTLPNWSDTRPADVVVRYVTVYHPDVWKMLLPYLPAETYLYDALGTAIVQGMASSTAYLDTKWVLIASPDFPKPFSKANGVPIREFRVGTFNEKVEALLPKAKCNDQRMKMVVVRGQQFRQFSDARTFVSALVGALPAETAFKHLIDNAYMILPICDGTYADGVAFLATNPAWDELPKEGSAYPTMEVKL